MEPMEIIGQMILIAVVVYASIIDIKTHRLTAPTYFSLAVLCGISLIHTPAAALQGIVITALPLVISGLLMPERIGGGDIHFTALCGGILTGYSGLSALFIGLLACLIFVPIIKATQKKPLKTAFIPLIPFLSAGFLAAEVFNI